MDMTPIFEELKNCKPHVVMKFIEWEGYGIVDSFDTVKEARTCRNKEARKSKGPVILVSLIEKGRL